MFFYADPFVDKPIDDVTTIQEFFRVEFQTKEDLPAMMLVDPVKEKIQFLQPIEEISEDLIADMVGEHAFVDLFSSILQKDTEGLIKAYANDSPESHDKPADPNAFNGIFNEL